MAFTCEVHPFIIRLRGSSAALPSVEMKYESRSLSVLLFTTRLHLLTSQIVKSRKRTNLPMVLHDRCERPPSHSGPITASCVPQVSSHARQH